MMDSSLLVGEDERIAAGDEDVADRRRLPDVVDGRRDVSSGMSTSSSPTSRRRVQWRQFMEQMFVTRRRTRSG